MKSFKKWFQKIDKNELLFLEPFAGALDLPNFISEVSGQDFDWSFFDIEPQMENVAKNDSIKNFPKGYDFCITNPPYLAKNSAKRRGLKYPDTHYDDVYKLSLSLCLKECSFVAAIIPESFITSGLFRERLDRVISLTFNPFDDTEHPVCLALFSKEESKDFEIFRGEERIGLYSKLKDFLPEKSKGHEIKFNKVEGQLGLVALDNTLEESIRFCDKEEIGAEEIKVSSRARTRIFLGKEEIEKMNKKYGSVEEFIKALNLKLRQLRGQTQDVFMTSFKGLREDGKYRRRLDFRQAKDLISSCLNS